MKRILLIPFIFINTILWSQETENITLGAGYANQVYYSLKNGIQKTTTLNSWDLAFSKSNLGSGIRFNGANYGLTSVLLNNEVSAGKVTDGSTINEVLESTHNYTLSSQINSVGYNWKAFQFSNFSYSIEDSLIFIIKDKNDISWNLEFTSFAGSSSGDLSFKKIQQGNITGLFQTHSNNNQMSIYPNPVQNGQTIHIDSDLSESSNYKIYNQAGEIIYITNEATRLENKSSELPSGLYLITQESNQSISTQRLTIS